MMGALVTVFFLLFFSGTVLGQDCDSLMYRDLISSKPQFSFRNTAYFNGERVYQYDSNNQKAVPEPEWKNVQDWDKESQIQKQRGDFAIETLKEIMNSSKKERDSHVLNGRIKCELCQNNATSGSWSYAYDGNPFIRFDKDKVAWIAEQPAATVIKQKWEENPGAVNRTKEYLEKECIETLKKFRDYKKAN
ncbi:zinc-alpha-2-glycoprotein [Sarcophilus harrisii]|uniref:MHC class I-like antigen recognition-like domain-containing protein n=1 Tax=Sarcophilus harrisii TaxID=9305 RepID=G3WY07_SARHA|nr:zinc-alpha-2-glycoprotein [Sarcophilus harrisii]